MITIFLTQSEFLKTMADDPIDYETFRTERSPIVVRFPVQEIPLSHLKGSLAVS